MKDLIVRPPAEPIVDAGDIPPEKRRWKPLEGRDWNPLLNYPRNNPCFCGSGKKFKKCCLVNMPRTCSTRLAKDLAVQVDWAHKMLKEKK